MTKVAQKKMKKMHTLKDKKKFVCQASAYLIPSHTKKNSQYQFHLYFHQLLAQSMKKLSNFKLNLETFLCEDFDVTSSVHQSHTHKNQESLHILSGNLPKHPLLSCLKLYCYHELRSAGGFFRLNPIVFCCNINPPGNCTTFTNYFFS